KYPIRKLRPFCKSSRLIPGAVMFSYMLYAACSLAGLIMVFAGIWLIAKKKIYIDTETKQPTSVELPLGVRLKINSPALAFFAIGFIPLLVPVYKLSPEKYHVVETAKITGSFDPQLDTVVVYASMAQDPVEASGRTYRLTAPFVLDANVDYKVL